MSATKSNERRLGRAPRPRPGLRIRLWQFTNGIAEWFDRDHYRRVLLGSILLGAIATIGWAMFVQLGDVRQLVSYIDQEAELRARAYSLKPPIALELDEVKSAIARAEARIVTDYGTLAGWLHSLQTTARARGVDLTYVVHEEQPFSDRAGLVAVPISFTGHRRERATQNPYHTSLEILRQVAEGRWLGELVGASGEGQGEGLVELKLEYRVWMHADDAFGADPIGDPTEDPTVATTLPDES